MKLTALITFCILLFSLDTSAQEPTEIPVESTISEVTVFINGAQILRKKQIQLPAGKSIVKFVGLSPYIDAKSVQPKISGNAMVLSVNYLGSIPAQKKQKLPADREEELNTKLENISNQLLIENSNREVIQAELVFLEENKKIGGANTGVTLTTLRETANYYRERLTQLKNQTLAINKKIQGLEVEKILINEINLQGNTPKEKPSPVGEIFIEMETKVATTINIELSYYVVNASWYPSYDIRATSIDKPIDLLYKANIQQNTKEDWKNVKLRISSSDPNLAGVAPKLKTYYLDYNMSPPRYTNDASSNNITGTIVDSSGLPLIGATVNIVGSTIGTYSDIDGKFSITLPPNSRTIKFSYLGYITQQLDARDQMIVYLEDDKQTLDEIIVVAHGAKNKSNIRASALPAIEAKSMREDIVMPTQQIESQIAVEFEVDVPYTIKSSNKNTTVEVDRYSLPADYEHYAIPRINKDAFLLANISDWEKYNLLEGEANVFFENTYIGKTILDTRHMSDTLSISLGRDKNILVSRESVKENNSKKTFSSNQEQTREWKITVKNNKNKKINFTLLDQIPVSRRNEIEVRVEEISKGILNNENGEVKWYLILKPTERKEVKLRYKVKSPNSKNLVIE